MTRALVSLAPVIARALLLAPMIPEAAHDVARMEVRR
jgi:hypothetical protein